MYMYIDFLKCLYHDDLSCLTCIVSISASLKPNRGICLMSCTFEIPHEMELFLDNHVFRVFQILERLVLLLAGWEPMSKYFSIYDVLT